MGHLPFPSAALNSWQDEQVDVAIAGEGHSGSNPKGANTRCWDSGLDVRSVSPPKTYSQPQSLHASKAIKK